MPVYLDWKEIALRLALTVIAGLVIGFNRGEHGRPAGMRTTLLVCLAASVAMIQANLLMPTKGKPSDSFVVLDLMRLPLGILSGMGFIGAGTILRKGSMIQGVTTAATLWFVTVMGLCFGGGQLGLGLAALGIGWVVLWGLKYGEALMRQDERGTLTVTVSAAGPADDALQEMLARGGCRVVSWGMAVAPGGGEREVTCELQWRRRPGDSMPPAVVRELCGQAGMGALRWRPQGVGDSGNEMKS